MVALHKDDGTSPPGPLSDERRGGVGVRTLRAASPSSEVNAPSEGVRRTRVRSITSRDIPLPLVSASMLVDTIDYADTGCEFAASCLKCPFSRCKYDEPEIFKLDAARRDREIAHLRQRYRAPIDALMRTYGISRTQVYRALREHGAIRRWRKTKRDARRRKREAGNGIPNGAQHALDL
jgi:hypothetical protein